MRFTSRQRVNLPSRPCDISLNGAGVGYLPPSILGPMGLGENVPRNICMITYVQHLLVYRERYMAKGYSKRKARLQVDQPLG